MCGFPRRWKENGGHGESIGPHRPGHSQGIGNRGGVAYGQPVLHDQLNSPAQLVKQSVHLVKQSVQMAYGQPGHSVLHDQLISPAQLVKQSVHLVKQSVQLVKQSAE